MGDPLLIGVDLGTTNGKVACYDLEGNLLAASMHSYATHIPKPGWYEQDPNDWRLALEQGLNEVVSALNDRADDVAGIAISNFGPGLVLVDQFGDAIAPCPTWQDERCQSQGQRLINEVGADWVGLGPPLTGFPAKLFWAIENVPELANQAYQITDIKAFLMLWLTGNAVTDPSSGPGATTWWNPVFEYVGWPSERLPRVISATESSGELKQDLAHRVGLRSGIPIFAGVNDGAAATLGSGAVRLSDSVVTLATNGVCRLVSSKRLEPETILDRHLFSWPFIEDRWICGGFTRSGAGSLQWLADLFGLPRDATAYDLLLEEASKVPTGSQGILFLPYLAGRGTPDANPGMRGGFLNLGLEHNRSHLARAVLEGISFALREIYEEFSRLGLNIGALHITGGGARSRLWRHIVTNVLDRPVTYAGGDSTLGDAIITSVGLGLYPDFPSATSRMVKIIDHEEPDELEVESYHHLFKVFEQTRDMLFATQQVPTPAGSIPPGGCQ